MHLRGIGRTHVKRRFIEQLWLTVMEDFSYTLAQYPRMELESEDPGGGEGLGDEGVGADGVSHGLGLAT